MLGKIGVFLIAAGIVCSAYGPETLSVVVTDGKGNRVRTLARADFQVVSRGSKNDIVAFTDATGAIPRRIAIVLDTTTISLPARVAIVDATRDFLAKSLRPVDRVLILTAGQSLTPLSEWTADKCQIEAALQRAATATSQTMAGDRAQAERRVQELITNIQQTRGTFDNFDTLMNAVRNYAAAVYRDTRQSIGLLATVTDLFPSRANRNVLIIGGAGLPIRPGADMFQYLDTVKAQAEQGLLGSALRQGAARPWPTQTPSTSPRCSAILPAKHGAEESRFTPSIRRCPIRRRPWSSRSERSIAPLPSPPPPTVRRATSSSPTKPADSRFSRANRATPSPRSHPTSTRFTRSASSRQRRSRTDNRFRFSRKATRFVSRPAVGSPPPTPKSAAA